MKALLTGGSGYVGTNLIRHLQERETVCFNYDVDAGYNILNYDDLWGATYGCDVIIHLAAMTSILKCEKEPIQAIRVNVGGTLNVAKVAQERGIHLMFSSTHAAKEAKNVYGLTKALGERIVSKVGGVIIRCANVYGGLSFLELKNSAIASFIKKKLLNEKATIYGDGLQERDFIHVDDVCRAFIAGLNAPSGIYEASTGELTSIKDLANKIGVNWVHGEKRAGDIQRPETGGEYIFGWKPIITLEQGLERMMDE